MDEKLKEALEKLGEDGFSVKTTGVKIEHIDDEIAVCSLEIEPRHLNSAGLVMGGAIYTLADFCFAVAANTGKPLTVTSSSSASFLKPVSSGRLTAEAWCLKDGRRSCCYSVAVTDGEDMVAVFTFNGIKSEEQS